MISKKILNALYKPLEVVGALIAGFLAIAFVLVAWATPLICFLLLAKFIFLGHL